MRLLFTLPIPDILVTTLTKAGYKAVEDLIYKNDECVAEALLIISSFGFTWNDIKSYISDVGSVNAAQRLRNEQFNESIPTFSEALDGILGGGVKTDTILQICGPPGSGKTQLALQLCVNVQIPVAIGGLGAESVFIDTEGTFSINRLKDVATGASEHSKKIGQMHKLNAETEYYSTRFILSGIHYVGVGSLVQFVSSIRRLRQLLQNNPNEILPHDSLKNLLLIAEAFGVWHHIHQLCCKITKESRDNIVQFFHILAMPYNQCSITHLLFPKKELSQHLKFSYKPFLLVLSTICFEGLKQEC